MICLFKIRIFLSRHSNISLILFIVLYTFASTFQILMSSVKGAFFPFAIIVVFISVALPLNRQERFYILNKIKIKPKNCRPIVEKIIYHIEKDIRPIKFTFKGYEIIINENILRFQYGELTLPQILRVSKNDQDVPLYKFQVCDLGCLFLNEFFYKTVTKDDKLELEKVLFQII